jgi:acyl-CoA synthetase (AMP-forming)/AMP-acid ligase II
MGFFERSRLVAQQIAATGKFLRDLPKFASVSHFGPADLAERNAATRPYALALAFEDERYSWADVDAISSRYAELFERRGIDAGDVVAVVMDNRPDYLFIELALNKLRAVAALVNTNLSGRPLAHAISVVHPELVVVGSEHLERLEAVIDELGLADVERRVLVKLDRDAAATARPTLDAELAAASAPLAGPNRRRHALDPMSYLFTSGTTGLPKAAIITNQRFLMVASAFSRIAHEAGPDDVIYSALPLYHGTAQWAGWAASLHSGAAFAFRRRFSASRFWDDVRGFGATRFVYIGELCRYLAHQPVVAGEAEHGVQIAVGNGLRPDVWEGFQTRFRIPLIREFYGATEGNAPLMNLDGKAGMVGVLRPGQAIVRCDPTTGELVRNARGRAERVKEGEAGLLIGRISPIAKFDGYLDDKSTQKKILRNVFGNNDAWFDSGDLLTLHEDGWVSFADRVGDTFRYKGENVSTTEVAHVLNAAQGVLESNVYGVEVPGVEGRVGMAALRTTDGFDLERFAIHVEKELPSYARPQFVRLENEIATTATFKHTKVDYKSEGWDPGKVQAPIYVLERGSYVRLDPDRRGRIARGEFDLR